MKVVIDLETDALEKYTKIHCIVCLDVDTGEEYVFEEYDAFKAFANNITLWIGHNFISFDRSVLHSLLGIEIPLENILDTLIFSRLLNYKIKGGHSIEAWGNRLGYRKEGVGIKDWSVYTEEMLERCKSDCQINLRLYKFFLRYLKDKRWEEPIRVEQGLQELCDDLHRNGFPFDNDTAQSLRDRLVVLITPIDNELLSAFPPKAKLLREIHPRLTKHGTLNKNDFRWTDGDLTIFNGGPFSLFEFESFNPSSPKQIVERLNEAGWKPTEKTKGYKDAIKNRDKEKIQKYKSSGTGWTISEENLRTLPDEAPPAAKKLSQRILLASRISDLEEWIEQVKEGVIHGRFLGIGSWSHRMAHQKPNMANIPVAKRSDKDTEFQSFVNDISDEMRSLWVARPGKRLIGVDAEGIQIRLFAHYVNDPGLIKTITEGKKEDATSIHYVNKQILGDICRSYTDAKTFTYAWVLGVGSGTASQILQCSVSEAQEALDRFLLVYPGLKDLQKERIPKDAQRGYFEGLDGRLVAVESAHKVLAGYLQNGEKVIMARAAVEWNKELRKQGLPYTFRDFVHDEWQVETEDDDEISNAVAGIMASSLLRVSNDLGLACPVIAGKPKFGYSWKDTH